MLAGGSAVSKNPSDMTVSEFGVVRGVKRIAVTFNVRVRDAMPTDRNLAF
jgi:hypothetical protein